MTSALHNIIAIFSLVLITVDKKYEDKSGTSSDDSEAESDQYEKSLQSITLIRDVVGLGRGTLLIFVLIIFYILTVCVCVCVCVCVSAAFCVSSESCVFEAKT